MNPESAQHSRTIESVSRALAGWTVARHVESDPTLPARYVPSWSADWTANVQSQLAYLAQAVAVRTPEVFEASVRWTRDAGMARGATVADLDACLRHLRGVLVDELPPSTAAAAVACLDLALSANAAVQPEAAPRLAGPHAPHAVEYLEHILAGRRAEAVELVASLAAGGLRVVDILVHVLHPAQAFVGHLWHRNEITIAEEHRATAATQQAMSRLRAAGSAGAPRGTRAVAAAVGGDFHELGIRMVTDALEMDGWEVVYYGSNLPASEALAALRRERVDLLALSASTFLHLRELGTLIDAVRADTDVNAVKIMVGGPPLIRFPTLCGELGADGLAANAAEAVACANRLVPARRTQ